MNRLLDIDPASTVVLTIDMQRDYLDNENGTNCVAPEDARRVLSSTSRVLRRAREMSIPVIHVYVTRRREEINHGLAKSEFARLGAGHGLVMNPRARPSPGPDRPVGSIRAQLMAELDEPADLHVTGKKTMDAFLGTELDMLLGRTFHASAVILAGINTDTCVLSSAFAATNRGYRTIVLADCTASIRGATAHHRALSLMSGAFAWVVDADELAMLTAQP